MFLLLNGLVSHRARSLSIAFRNFSHESDFLCSLELASIVFGPVSDFNILGGSRNLLFLFD